MGTCINCKFCTDPENDSLNNSLQISKDFSIIDKFSKINSIYANKDKSLKNKALLNNINLSSKEKNIFEKKISSLNKKKNKIIIRKVDGVLSTRYNELSNKDNDKLDISDNSLSISTRMLINEISQSPEKKYKVLKNIGHGSFGDVFLAYNIYTKVKVAIKKIFKSNEDLLSDGEIMDEIEILKCLNHPDIVKIIEFYGTEEAYYIVNEFCPWGELYNKANGQMSETQISVIFRQILSGLSYLHSKNIVHRDLKLENILISDKEYIEATKEEYFDVKIIDFGNARIFNNNNLNKPIVGSIYYIAPEVFNKKYNMECDLWSAGVILYMLITGCPPFDGEDNKKIMEKIKIGIFDKNNINYKNSSFEVKDLISKLLVIDPNKRLTANQALQHPWLNKTKSNILYYNISKDEILKCIQNILSYNIKSRYEEIVLAYIVHNLPQQKEIKTIIKLFKIINKKGDGKLDKKELKYGLLNFVSDNYLKNLDEIFNLLDGEKRGYIEYEEFLRAGLDRKQILAEENLKYAFNFFDKENNGYITKDRMKIFFVKPIIDEELYNRTFDEIDKNKDGKIDYQEFKDMMLYN